MVKPQSVYIAIDRKGMVKIGVAGNPAVRVRQVERDHGEPLSLCWQSKWHEHGRRIENVVHSLLRDRHLPYAYSVYQTEWFQVTVDEAINAVQEAFALWNMHARKAIKVADARPRGPVPYYAVHHMKNLSAGTAFTSGFTQ